MLFHRNKLVKLNKFIFQFGQKKDYKHNVLYLLVHPYASNLTYEKDSKFTSKRDALLIEENNPIIILVENKNFEATVKRYGKTKFKGNRYIIVTEESNPKPLDASWSIFKKWIMKTINPEKIVVCGAELHLNSKNIPYTGCVLEAFEKIEGITKVVIDKSKCWIE